MVGLCDEKTYQTWRWSAFLSSVILVPSLSNRACSSNIGGISRILSGQILVPYSQSDHNQCIFFLSYLSFYIFFYLVLNWNGYIIMLFLCRTIISSLRVACHIDLFMHAWLYYEFSCKSCQSLTWILSDMTNLPLNID